jgi:hypothetical protein
MQLAPWPPYYKATPPPEYHGDSEPRKFHMCYEAAIASSGVNDTTFTMAFIISLECTTENWYARL